MSLVVGNHVLHATVPGLARVGEVQADKVRLDCFESVTQPIAEQIWAKSAECRRVRLGTQTRVFWQDPDTGSWRAGRIVGGEPSGTSSVSEQPAGSDPVLGGAARALGPPGVQSVGLPYLGARTSLRSSVILVSRC
jgi:hypothetical protein